MLFDAYVFVDWSARTGRGSARPRKDSIWIGTFRRGRPAAAQYCRTRAEGTAHVRTLLLEALARGERVLAGFDFPLGYPRGFAKALGLEGPAWRATWDALSARLIDGDDNRSNRFEVAMALNAAAGGGPGPFWGRPISRRNPADAPVWRALAPTSPGFRPAFMARGGVPLVRLRTCDARLTGVQECWKLLGVGSVGSQALTGIPRVRALRDDPALMAASAVWPFETGFATTLPEGVRILLAECWPGIVEDRVRLRSEAIRDEAQVLALCEWARELDRAGALAKLLGPQPGLEGEALRAVVEEEGWVLGQP
ncbi:MAG: hypothetical protein QM704_00765 [Anaeromyxobacteraceae bacterium]